MKLMHMRTVGARVLVALAILAGVLAVYGQIVSGTVVGTVSDASGGAAPKAQITLRNLDTNQTRQAATNDGGAFTFATLPPGQYRVSASHPGFKSAVTSDI